MCLKTFQGTSEGFSGLSVGSREKFQGFQESGVKAF